MFALKTALDKWIRRVRCIYCRLNDIDEILAQNDLTTSTTTTSSTTTTTTEASTTTTTTV